MKTKLDRKLIYSLGVRDGMALFLAETMNKVRLPEQSKEYTRLFEDRHFSAKWHESEV